MPPTATEELEREAGVAAPESETPAPEEPTGSANGGDPNPTDEDGDGTDGGYPEAGSAGAKKAQEAEQFTLDGSDSITATIGGERPKGAFLKVNGMGNLPLKDRQFTKGEYVDLHVRVRIKEVGAVDDLRDNGETIVDTNRKHVGVAVSVKELASHELEEQD